MHAVEWSIRFAIGISKPKAIMKMINGYPLTNVYALLLVSIFASISLASNNYVNGQDGISAAFVGDISCNSNGIATLNAIKADNPDAFIILGDMSYEPLISCFSGYTKDLIKVLLLDVT